MNPIRVIIADDHIMVREGIKQILELEGDIKVIAEADDGIQALYLINEMKPDVTLLDINMPNMNGLQVLESLRKSKSSEKVLLLTIHNEVEYLVRAVDIGINGYVLKDSESAILKKAIYAVNQDETYIEPSLSLQLKERMNNASTNAYSTEKQLTKREIEVLKLLAEGLFNKEIAYKLSISEKTVKNHVSNIFKKISVFDRTQAAVYAIKNNYVNIM